MRNRLLSMSILVLGFLLALLALAWAIALSLEGQLAQNSGLAVALGIVGLLLMATSWRK